MLLNPTPTSAWNCIRLNPRREYFTHSFNKDLLTIYYVPGSLWIFEIHQEQMIKPSSMKLTLYSQWLFFAYSITRKSTWTASLAVQWLRLHTSDSGGRGFIPGPGTIKIPCATWHGQTIKNKKERQTMNLNNSMVRKTVTSLVSFANKQEKSRHNQCSLSPSLRLSIPSRQNLRHHLERNF